MWPFHMSPFAVTINSTDVFYCTEKDSFHSPAILFQILSSFPHLLLALFSPLLLEKQCFLIKTIHKTIPGSIKTCEEAVRARVKPGVLTHHLREGGGLHIQHDGALLYAGPQLEQAVQRQGGHVRFAPSLPSLFHLLLKLDPPATGHSNDRGLRLLPPCREINQHLWRKGTVHLHYLGSSALMVGLGWSKLNDSVIPIQAIKYGISHCQDAGSMEHSCPRPTGWQRRGREEHIPAMSEGVLGEQMSHQRRRHKLRSSFLSLQLLFNDLTKQVWKIQKTYLYGRWEQRVNPGCAKHCLHP